MDETYIKIKGRWHYLYRAIDADGLTLDIWLRKKRDTQAAYAFLKRLHKQFGEPKAIVTDKAPSLGSAFRKLQSVGLHTKTDHRLRFVTVDAPLDGGPHIVVDDMNDVEDHQPGRAFEAK